MEPDANQACLPDGWRLELGARARRFDDGRLLVGGSPRRMLRLTDAGSRWLDAVAAGRPLPTSKGARQLARRLVELGIAHPRPLPSRERSAEDVALVVPVRDDSEGVARLLRSVGEVGEIVVIDDCSAVPVQVSHPGTPMSVVRQDRHGGPSTAREGGWRRVRRPIVAFVDADVQLGAGWLTALLGHFDDPTVGAVAPRVRSAQGSAPRWLAEYEAVRSPLDMGARPATVCPGGAVPYVPTAALVVRRAALESIDGFDVALRTGEDVDLVWRLRTAGWSVRYEPRVEVSHATRADLPSWLRQRLGYGSSAAPLARRHGSSVAPIVLSPAMAALWAAVVVRRWPWGLAVGLVDAVLRAARIRAAGAPTPVAARLAVGVYPSHVGFVGSALRRPWWPLTAVLMARGGRARWITAALAGLPVVADALRDSRRSFGRLCGLRVLDDLAYGTGVWIGCLRQRSVRALMPVISWR